ncbi:putative uncharacterized protein DDB_G0282129 [Condylostylus longicornis]|uniref:putative uncharacterized protein DDB_G0282129 n=1 Tax=Condylostylus longicornis TaxID=2530218 RepID=UPI00244DF6C3|nr:putative uncharacterized protein DDB_G0282129 [Condylostylus longicornis]
MLLPDETYEQAIRPTPSTETILIQSEIAPRKKLVEFYSPNLNDKKNHNINNNTHSQITTTIKPSSSITSVATIKEKFKKSCLLPTNINKKSLSITNLKEIITKNDEKISKESHDNNYNRIQSNKQYQKQIKEKSPTISTIPITTISTSTATTTMINHYSNCNITSSSPSSSFSPTSTSSSKRRNSIASYDRTSDFFNHIPDFIGEALNPFTIKNFQQQKQLHKKQQYHQYNHQQHQQQKNRNIVKKSNLIPKVTIINGHHLQSRNNSNHNNNDDDLVDDDNNSSDNSIDDNGEFDSFNNSSDILKICEEFLWRYRIRPDFFCKYHKALRLAEGNGTL